MLFSAAADAHRSRPPVVLDATTIAQLGDFLGGIVADAFDVAADELRAPSRGPAQVALARQCAMYLGRVLFSLNYSEVGQAFRRDRTTAAHACRVIESHRDDPAFDAMLRALETLCAGLDAAREDQGMPA